MLQDTNINQQSNIEAQVVVGPPLLPALYKGQKIYSGPYSITVTEEMARQRERENQEIFRQWVAQLSTEGRRNDQDEYYAEFKNHKIRRIFIRKVFCVLSLLILFTIGVVSFFLFVAAAREFLFQHLFLSWIALAIFIIFYLVIVCAESARRNSPCNWICLFILTLSMSYLMACISVSYQLEVIMSGGITTAAITLVITFLATFCSFDLTKRRVFLLIVGLGGLALLFIVVPIHIFTGLKILNMVIGVIGSIIISMYLYFDIQTIMGGREIEMRPDEVVYAVTRLYVDILTLYQYTLSGVLPLASWGILANGILIVIPFCTSGFLVLPAFYTIFFGSEDIEVTEAVNILSELLEILVGALKVMLLLPKRRKLFNLVNLCNHLWENVKDEEEAETVKHYATRAMYLTYGFFFNVFCALMSLLIQPAFSKFIFDSNGTLITSKQLPYSSGLFHENIQIFNIWYILQIPAGLVSIIPIIGVDTAVAFFVLHACAHFKLLQFRMFKFKQLKEEKLEKNSKEAFKEIVKIVEHHQCVLQYSAIVENIFSPVVLLQTILSIIAICGFGFNLLMRREDTMKYGLHLVGGALQLLMFCWPPNNLQSESINIGMKAYDFPWHQWTKKEGRLVEIIISRSQKVAFLSAGKFVFMSLQTFSSILSSAFSFFTLLRRIL